MFDLPGLQMPDRTDRRGIGVLRRSLDLAIIRAEGGPTTSTEGVVEEAVNVVERLVVKDVRHCNRC